MEFNLRKTCVVVDIFNCPIYSQSFSECNGAFVIFLYEYPKDAVVLACKGFVNQDTMVVYVKILTSKADNNMLLGGHDGSFLKTWERAAYSL